MPELTSHLPQAIFFDLDGTLLDSLPGIIFSIEQAFLACDLPMQPIDLRRVIGPPIRTILELASKQASSSDLDRLELAFRCSYDSEGWQKTSIFPGSNATLREAYALGIPLFVVSNKPRYISIKILEREGMAPFFTAIVTRDTKNPPYTGKAQMMEHLIERFEFSASRCLMIGDTEEDGFASAAMQVPFAFMSHGYGEITSSLAVAFRLNSFADLLPKLVKEFAQ